MTAVTSSEAFAAASAAMVRGDNAASTVHVLAADCISLLRAHTAGILIRTADDDLELLAATSHQATELELHQANNGSGPCFDAIKTGYAVAAADDEIQTRWPRFAVAMQKTGLCAVHAVPLRWHTRVLGGLNLFWTEPVWLNDEQAATAQAFGDICSLALMQAPAVPEAGQLDERLRAALESRVVIERAKGVLSQDEGLDMASAFQRLVQLSEAAQVPLTDTATMIVNQTFTS
jgi:transcriptional regulator with GAF, ATPase, and Fis domain